VCAVFQCVCCFSAFRHARFQEDYLTSPLPIVVSQIHVYPVKSLGGMSPLTARVEPRGLQHDRRWMLTDPDGRFWSQRALPRMALISARIDIDNENLHLQAPALPPLRVPLTPPLSAPFADVRVWNSECRAALCAPDAALYAPDAALCAPDAALYAPDADRWLSDFLQSPCRLVFMPDSAHRQVPAEFRRAQGLVSFADAFPLLLLSEASLQDLNARLAVPVPMDRFRPNIVVSGTAPYAEDGWQTITLGETVFHVVKPCARCGLTTIDQATGTQGGAEPLRTLAEFRRRDDKVVFGQYLIPAAPGIVSVGMRVQGFD